MYICPPLPFLPYDSINHIANIAMSFAKKCSICFRFFVYTCLFICFTNMILQALNRNNGGLTVPLLAETQKTHYAPPSDIHPSLVASCNPFDRISPSQPLIDFANDEESPTDLTTMGNISQKEASFSVKGFEPLLYNVQ